jgi:hypothetical protein
MFVSCRVGWIGGVRRCVGAVHGGGGGKKEEEWACRDAKLHLSRRGTLHVG